MTWLRDIYFPVKVCIKHVKKYYYTNLSTKRRHKDKPIKPYEKNKQYICIYQNITLSLF